MGVGVVELAIHRFDGLVVQTRGQRAGGLLGNRAAPPAARIDRLREVDQAGLGKAGLAHELVHLGDQIQMQDRRFRLLHQQAARLQCAQAVDIELGTEQAFGRPDRIGRVDDDHVETFRRGFLHPGQAVAEEQRCARVVVGHAQLGKVLLGETRHAFVDLDLRGRLHFRVLEHFAQRAAVTTADDHHMLRRAVRVQRRVRHHLVIQEVVAGGHHRAAVDGHQVTEGFGPVDVDLLERRLLAVHVLAEFQRKCRPGLVDRLREPAFVQ